MDFEDKITIQPGIINPDFSTFYRCCYTAVLSFSEVSLRTDVKTSSLPGKKIGHRKRFSKQAARFSG